MSVSSRAIALGSSVMKHCSTAAGIALLAVGALAAPGVMSSEAIAAEALTISNGIGRRSIDTEDLQTYAETGNADGTLAYFTEGLSGEKRRALRRSLRQNIDVDFVPFANFLQSDVGTVILEELAESILPGAPNVSGSQALRAAFIGAAQDGQMSVNEILALYPTQEVVIDWVDIQEKAELFQSSDGNFRHYINRSGLRDAFEENGVTFNFPRPNQIAQAESGRATPTLMEQVRLFQSLNQLQQGLNNVMTAFAQ